MTKVLLQYGSPAPDGSYPPVEGVLIWTPTRRRVIAGMPDKIIMPVGFKVPITGGVITVTVAPSGIDWVWRVDELVKGANRVISYKAVPDADEVEFTELVSVNPTTLTAIAEPEPIWYPWAEALAETAGRAEQSAEDSKLAAIESQTSALASKNAAAGSATEAYNFMQAAGGHASYAGSSAFSAGTSAATALGHKNDAEAAEAGAVAAESNAKLYRDMANISRSAAESAQLASEDAKTDTLSARDEAVAAHGATVTTGEVDENGHLILTRTDTTPIDAGYVVGPPIQLSISDTVTGPETPGIIGPQGIQGVKGDPGGIINGTYLNATLDLNTLVTDSGVWRTGVASEAAISRNYPVDNIGGTLFVYVRSTSGPIVTQEYHTTSSGNNGRNFWRRVNVNGAWSPWASYSYSRTSQTAGRTIYVWDEINNRDQLIYGDTGIRRINPLNAANTTGNMDFRRNGYSVEVAIDALKATANGALTLASVIPAGFRPAKNGISFQGRVNAAPWATRRVNFLSNGDVSFADVADFINETLVVTATYMTNDAWPITLPGTAQLSIPYQ